MKALVHAVSGKSRRRLRGPNAARRLVLAPPAHVMSAAEIPRMRLYRAARDRIWPRLPTAAADGLRLKPAPPGIDRGIPQALPEQVEAILHDARRTLGGAITIFGKAHHFTDAVDWHRDVITGRRWPGSFAP